MYELLLRTETLFLGLNTPVLLAIGIPALVVGLILWLGGTRHSTAITGVLGAVVGSAAGLLVSQWLNLHPWLSMLVGAAVLAGASILLRNILILVLAVLVFSAVSGAGYLAVVLDRAVPQARPTARAEQRMAVQYFSGMDSTQRLDYMSDISQEGETFGDRLKALLDDTWEAIRPYGWMAILAIAIGAVVGLLLVWFIAKIIIAVAYSIVGTAVIFLGVQAALLGAGFAAVSALEHRRLLLPIAFLTMVAIGWVWQLFHSGRKPAKEAQTEPDESR
jgi:hypothetical protein